MAIKRAHRVRVYAPRSVDATELTVLVPRAGAIHADAFQIATVRGLAGYQPYLEPPSGRTGKIDFLTMNTDAGTFAFDVNDQTVSGRTQRWVTAFNGDGRARDRWKGSRVAWETAEDYDPATGLGTWAATRTGRIASVKRAASGIYTFTCRGNASLLNRKCFIGPPATSVAYAFPAPILPFTLPQPWGTLGAGRPMTGVIGAGLADPSVLVVTQDDTSRRYGIISAALAAMFSSPMVAGFPLASFKLGDIKVRLTRLDTNATGAFWLRRLLASQNRDGHWSPTQLSLVPVDAGTFPLPPTGTSCTIVAFANSLPTQGAGLFVGDVPVIQYMCDLIDGKFGYLDATGAPLAGIPRDTAAWAPLLADASFPTVRFLEEEASQKVGEVLKKKLSPIAQVAIGEDAQGRLYPIDLRRPTSVAGLATIADADLVSDAAQPTWETAENDAITQIRFRTVRDEFADWRLVHQDMSEFPVALSCGVRQTVLDPGYIVIPNTGNRASDLEDNPLEVDAGGLHFAAGETLSGQLRALHVQRYLERISRDYEGPFTDPQRVTLHRRRLAAPPKHGDLVLFDLSRVPNRSTAALGGQQLGRITTWQEQKDGTYTLEVLHLGAASQSVAPVVGALAADATVPRHRLAVPVTMNAAADPVVIQIAVTDTATAVRPGATDGRWTMAGEPATGAASTLVTTTLDDLPAGARIWVRVRAQSLNAEALQLPSAWVFPTGSGFLDTSAIPAPAALATVGTVYAHSLVLGWTNGDATLPVEVYLTTGAVVPAAWSAGTPDVADRIDLAGAGDTSLPLRTLNGPSASHVIGLRHRDRNGGVSPMATLAVTTGATNAKAPTLRSLAILTL